MRAKILGRIEGIEFFVLNKPAPVVVAGAESNETLDIALLICKQTLVARCLPLPSRTLSVRKICDE